MRSVPYYPLQTMSEHLVVMPTKVLRIWQVAVVPWENTGELPLETSQRLLETWPSGIFRHANREVLCRQSQGTSIKQPVV